jgi:hypothetical protein
MKWIVFKKNPLTDKVVYSINDIENVQSAKEIDFISFVKKNFVIQDLEKFYKLLNSHILITLENGEIKPIKEFNSYNDLLEKSLKINEIEITKTENYDIKSIQNNIKNYTSKLLWKQ